MYFKLAMSTDKDMAAPMKSAFQHRYSIGLTGSGEKASPLNEQPSELSFPVDSVPIFYKKWSISYN